MIVAVGNIKVAGCVRSYPTGTIQQCDSGSPAISAGEVRSTGSAAPGILTGLLMRQAGIIRGRLFSVVGQEQLFQPTAVSQQAPPRERLFFIIKPIYIVRW